jgi:DMSO/TMAO reductase YedYZ molybdopterin-dependent catalytic subunit
MTKLLIGIAYAALMLAQPATLTVSGDLPSPLTLTIQDLDKMPRETVTVSEKDGSKVSYQGVPLREVLTKAGLPFAKQLRGKTLASYVVAKAHDGYEVVFTLPEMDPDFANESILLADKRDGKALSETQGPLRLVCANDKVGACSVRMLEKLEFVRLKK